MESRIYGVRSRRASMAIATCRRTIRLIRFLKSKLFYQVKILYSINNYTIAILIMPSSLVSLPAILRHEPTEQATVYLENNSQKTPSMVVQQEESGNLSKASTDIDIDLSGTRGEGPDIDWVPSLKSYMARVERLSKSQHTRAITLPHGFPEKIKTHRAWVGHDFAEDKSYIYVLSETEVSEIEEALSHFKGLYSFTHPDFQ